MPGGDINRELLLNTIKADAAKGISNAAAMLKRNCPELSDAHCDNIVIFSFFPEGMTPHSIAAELTRRGIKTPRGKDKWNQQTVRRLRRREALFWVVTKQRK